MDKKAIPNIKTKTLVQNYKMNDFNQIVSGSLCQVSTDQKELYGFVFLKQNIYGDGYIVDTSLANASTAIKSEVDGKIVTCVGKFPVTFSGVTGSKDVFLFDNRLIASLSKNSSRFCSVLK